MSTELEQLLGLGDVAEPTLETFDSRYNMAGVGEISNADMGAWFPRTQVGGKTTFDRAALQSEIAGLGGNFTRDAGHYSLNTVVERMRQLATTDDAWVKNNEKQPDVNLQLLNDKRARVADLNRRADRLERIKNQVGIGERWISDFRPGENKDWASGRQSFEVEFATEWVNNANPGSASEYAQLFNEIVGSVATDTGWPAKAKALLDRAVTAKNNGTPLPDTLIERLKDLDTRGQKWALELTRIEGENEKKRTAAASAKQGQQFLKGALSDAGKTAASAMDDWLKTSVQTRALQGSKALDSFLVGDEDIQNVIGTMGQQAAATEAQQAMDYNKVLFSNQDAIEAALLKASKDDQDNAMKAAGVQLSDDLQQNKNNLANWLNNLDNAIKNAGITSQAEAERVRAFITKKRNELAREQYDRKNTMKFVGIILGGLSVLSGAILTIATAGAAAPAGVAMALGGATTLAANLAS